MRLLNTLQSTSSANFGLVEVAEEVNVVERGNGDSRMGRRGSNLGGEGKSTAVPQVRCRSEILFLKHAVAY